jgi:hypothetical protein
VTKAWAPFICAVLSVDALTGVGVLAGAVAPTPGVLGLRLELPPPQAVTKVAAIAIAAVRKSADVIIVFLSQRGEDNVNVNK